MNITIKTRSTVMPQLYEKAVDSFDRLQVDYGCKRQRLEKLINQLKQRGKSEAEIYGKIICAHRWFAKNRKMKRRDARKVLDYYHEKIFIDLKIFQKRKPPGRRSKYADNPFYRFLVDEKKISVNYALKIARHYIRMLDILARENEENICQTKVYKESNSSIRSLLNKAFELHNEFLEKSKL